jgi:hypothetical protein
MSTKHYPYMGGNFDRIIFDGDGSVWVPESENAKLRELVQKLYANLRNRETILELMRMPPSEAAKDEVIAIIDKCSELGIEVK